MFIGTWQVDHLHNDCVSGKIKHSILGQRMEMYVVAEIPGVMAQVAWWIDGAITIGT